MFPPTIRMAPTSEIVRPKPARTAVTSRRRAIASRCGMARSRVAPSTCSAPPYSAHKSADALCTSAVTIGSASTVCASTIAPGVNSIPRAPSGPERDDQIESKTDDDRGEPQQRVERHDEKLSAREAVNGE